MTVLNTLLQQTPKVDDRGVNRTMKVFRTVCNQWSVGFGLRRWTLSDHLRWQLWFNLGYRTVSYDWGRNATSRSVKVD